MLSFSNWMTERAVTLAHSLNIDRHELPQIRSFNVPDYLEWLQKTHHVSHHKESVPAKSLKPIQKAIETDRVHAMKPGQSMEKPMVVSKDSYILDGHHRWYQAMEAGQDLTIIRVSVGMRDLLKITKDYPKVEYHAL